jgi:dynein heavy chain, axonemal
MVFNFKESMPIVLALGNPKLKDRHWTQIKQTIGTEEELEKMEFTLDQLVNLKVA